MFERVAAAGVVLVVARVAGHQPVVGRIVQPAEAQRGAEVVAFGGVVVDDVENDLDAGAVQHLDHRLKLVRRVAGGAVAPIGREEADGVVAPVVAQAALHQVPVVDKALDRQQLHRRHAEALQVGDRRRAGEPGVGAAQRRRHGVIAHREAAHVQLVDQGVVPRRSGRAVVVPIEGRIDHLALGHRGRVVAPVEGEVRALRADLVAEVGVGPAQRASRGPGIWIEQQPVGIEALAEVGAVGAVGAEAVERSRNGAGQVAMPDEVGALRQRAAHQFAPPAAVEDAQVDGFGMLREHREVHTFAVPACPQGVRPARPENRLVMSHDPTVCMN